MRPRASGASAETPDQAWDGGRWEAPFEMVLADHEPEFLNRGPNTANLPLNLAEHLPGFPYVPKEERKNPSPLLPLKRH